MAWVAGPVVGGVAAIALIAVSFAVFRRRRRASGAEEPSDSRLSPLTRLFSPLSDGNRGSGKRKSRLGNFSAVESGRPSVEVARMVQFIRGRPVGMERLADIEDGEAKSERDSEKAGKEKEKGKEGTPAPEAKNARPPLRKSLNGLSQNKWS
jgi:hypothetical protein